MSSPGNMRTGKNIGGGPENVFTETFHIIYLILMAFLRRSGYKDCLLYGNHNSVSYNDDLFDSGILFNLKSQHGIGMSLRPLAIELFTRLELDPHKNKHNVFFREMVRLTGMVSKIKRSHNPTMETHWMINYAIDMEPVIDDIALERESRLENLMGNNNDNHVPMEIDNDIDNDIDNNETESTDLDFDDPSDDDISDISDNESMSMSEEEEPDVIPMKISNSSRREYKKICFCPFCKEFRNFHSPPHVGRNIVSIIDKELIQLTKTIYNT
jgi:hypothetical protein